MCPSSPGEPLSSCHRKSPAHNNYQVAADLGEEHSFPIPGQAVTPRHTSQPPSAAGGRVTAAIRGNGAKERDGREVRHPHYHHLMLLNSGPDQCESLHRLGGCILFSHDYHHFALVFAPVPSSRAQANWDRVRGARQGHTLVIYYDESRVDNMRAAGNTENILLCNNTNGKIVNYPNPKTKYHYL